MYLGFKPDLFSISKVIWTNKINDKNLQLVKKIVKKNILNESFSVRQIKGFELNSNNFKISFKSRTFILKKWGKNKKISEINKIIKLINWLKSKKIPIQSPQKFKNNKFILKNKSELWSYFDYMPGNHFTGEIQELKNTVKIIGKLAYELDKYPKKNIKKLENYFSKQDLFTLKTMFIKYNNLIKFFGKKHTRIIKYYLPEISSLFKKLSKSKLSKIKKKNVAHIDLHPHNLITREKKLVAILDIDSCKIVNTDHAIAYACLKLCKQTFIFNKSKLSKQKIIDIFKSSIKKKYKLSKVVEKNLYYFAVSEVLRRLLYMFRLTLFKNNKKWNDVIPLQLGHLDECREFFLKND